MGEFSMEYTIEMGLKISPDRGKRWRKYDKIVGF